MESAINDTASAARESPPATLLFVDDESNILSSLKRLFRPAGYRILTAESGRAALEILTQEKVDLVVSDMRMPEMDGATFLEKVCQQYPDTVRILLTGYSDLGSAISAINQGGIYRYISKPWEDNDLKLSVANALKYRQLESEKARLDEIVMRQNEELRQLNTNLEETVKARTEELRQTVSFLDTVYEDLKNSYRATIPVFAHLVELREGALSGHSRRVAELARHMAEHLKLSAEDTDNIYFAGLLRDIGKIGLPDMLFKKPFSELGAAEREQVMQHPVLGQEALMALDPLQEAGKLIRHHHERYDGRGYPDGLAGEQIPLGARILALINDFDALQLGTVVEGRLSRAEARKFLSTNRGTRYDPKLVDLFLTFLDTQVQEAAQVTELRLASTDLREGMVLAKDLVSADGVLLLSRGQVLKASLIERIQHFERLSKRGYTLHIEPFGETEHA